MKTFVCFMFLVLLLVPATLVVGQQTDHDVAIELVNKAVGAFQSQGKEAAIKLANSSYGPLRKASIYVFVTDFKGKMLAHPAQEDLRGKDCWELQDAKGKFIIQDFIKIAKDPGEGWSDYSWLRVNEKEPTLKKTFVKRVPGEDIFVAAGYYVK